MQGASPRHSAGDIGLADLLRLARHLPDAELKRIAPLLGCSPARSARPMADNAETAGTVAPGAEAEHATGPAPRGALKLPLVKSRRRLRPPIDAEPSEEAVIDADANDETDLDLAAIPPLPPAPELVPRARLRPLLRQALSRPAERHRVDVRRLVAAQARLRPMRRMPRLSAPHWTPRAQIILHLAERLFAFREDFFDLATAVGQLRGATGIQILAMFGGPDQPVCERMPDGWGDEQPYQPPPAGVPVLILSDLGCLGGARERADWAALGLRLAARGHRGGARPVVLTPCPPRWWDRRLDGLFAPVLLDRKARIPARLAGARAWLEPVRALNAPVSRVHADPGAERLLALLSPCISITPALMRHLRRRLADPALDVGSEAAAWQHPAFRQGAYSLVPNDSQLLDALVHRQRAEAKREAAFLRDARLAWDLIRAQRRLLGSGRNLIAEEHIRYHALLEQASLAGNAYHERVDRALAAAEQRADQPLVAQLQGRAARLGQRMPETAWRHSPIAAVLWLRAHPSVRDQPQGVPRGLDLDRARATLGEPEQPARWRLLHQAGLLSVAPERAGTDTEAAPGSMLARQLRTRYPHLLVRERRPGGQPFTLPLGEQGAALPMGQSDGDAGWEIQTADEQLTITPASLAELAPWAHTIGQDADGLFVGFSDGAGGEAGERRAYWCPLRDGQPDWLDEPPPEASPDPSDQHPEHEPAGFFMDQTQFRQLRAHGLPGSRDGMRLERDRYGIRGELNIKGIPVGFRWIWPGEFLMGSPPGETGRFDKEQQHPVILTRGLWLAETTCTQALWQAVMGKNPSDIKGDQRPVENVSWDDVIGFIARLNDEGSGLLQMLGRLFDRHGQTATPDQPGTPELSFRLPTEAEWEYACRAGTTTAYHFGAEFDETKANNGSGTVDVRSLPPNRWGLYEMHGNVWEWCQDWYGAYLRHAVIDPTGPDAGDERVCRGGSWILHAVHCRSARRLRGPPDERDDYLGFRLALGPELRQDRQAVFSGPDGEPRGRTARAGSDREGADSAGGQAPRPGKSAPQ